MNIRVKNSTRWKQGQTRSRLGVNFHLPSYANNSETPCIIGGVRELVSRNELSVCRRERHRGSLTVLLVEERGSSFPPTDRSYLDALENGKTVRTFDDAITRGRKKRPVSSIFRPNGAKVHGKRSRYRVRYPRENTLALTIYHRFEGHGCIL